MIIPWPIVLAASTVSLFLDVWLYNSILTGLEKVIRYNEKIEREKVPSMKELTTKNGGVKE
ncbi:MAG: hypothetical protein FWD37_02115 [Methanomassiliicoccaceae archaeon]|nr:hypothetical protein [Methanomassiliicoccaceae archaeon]